MFIIVSVQSPSNQSAVTPGSYPWWQRWWWCHHVCFQWRGVVSLWRFQVSVCVYTAYILVDLWTSTFVKFTSVFTSVNFDPSSDLSSTSPSSDEDSNKSDQSESSNSDQLRERPIRRKRLKMSGASYIVREGRGQSKPAKRLISMAQYIAQGWIDSPPYKVRYLDSLATHSVK